MILHCSERSLYNNMVRRIVHGLVLYIGLYMFPTHGMSTTVQIDCTYAVHNTVLVLVVRYSIDFCK